MLTCVLLLSSSIHEGPVELVIYWLIEAFTIVSCMSLLILFTLKLLVKSTSCTSPFSVNVYLLSFTATYLLFLYS